jgi:coniferyl-aldehyde dehydrogenase
MHDLLDRQRAAFNAAPRPSASERRERLARLDALLKANQTEIAAAVSADFGNRAVPETVFSEIMTTRAAAAHARRHLEAWMRPHDCPVALPYRPARNRVEYVPLGVVGVVSPWNYPVFLTLGPLVDVLAAGNRCLLKPSEQAPHTAELLARLLGAAFATEEVAMVFGGADTSRSFCALPFDHLLFTGSTGVGREVMRAAAENLVPVTLELGGKSPVIVAEDADPARAAASVAVGKFFNAGQTCVSPDYALVPRASVQHFAEAVIAAAEAMFPTLAENPDATTIIADRHHARLERLVAEAEAAGARVLRHRSTAPRNTRHFPPTVVLDPPPGLRLMQEEIFGPILPVIGVEDLDQAIAFVNARPRPLALYAYTRNPATERAILDRTISGGVTLNGTLLHVSQPHLPFGGVGASGMGAYHGEAGFRRFSHARAIHAPGRVSGFERLRPPYGLQTRLALRLLAGFNWRR